MRETDQNIASNTDPVKYFSHQHHPNLRWWKTLESFYRFKLELKYWHRAAWISIWQFSIMNHASTACQVYSGIYTMSDEPMGKQKLLWVCPSDTLGKQREKSQLLYPVKTFWLVMSPLKIKLQGMCKACVTAWFILQVTSHIWSFILAHNLVTGWETDSKEKQILVCILDVIRGNSALSKLVI